MQWLSLGTWLRRYWILLAGGVAILLAVLAVGMMWFYLQDMERRQWQEHIALAAHITETSKTFIADGQYDYFYKLLKLLTRISFIKYLSVSLDDKNVIQAGDRRILSGTAFAHPDRLNAFASLDVGKRFLYVKLPFTYNWAQKAMMHVIFSVEGFKGPKRGSLAAFAVIVSLLCLLAYLGFKLFQTQQNLKKEEKFREDMIKCITHDARQDLTVIQGKMSTLLNRQRRGMKILNLEKDLKAAQESAESMVRYLNNLSDQRRLRKGEVEILPERLDIIELLQSLMASYEEKMAKRGMRFVFYPHVRELLLWCDPQIVKRVCMNVIHNAFKYSRVDSAIEIATRTGENMLQITFKDQGRGIEREYWEKIFEPYLQLDPDSPGIGLGLYTSRKLIRLCGGELGVRESAVGEGTTFYMTLPMPEPAQNEQREESGRARA